MPTRQVQENVWSEFKLNEEKGWFYFIKNDLAYLLVLMLLLLEFKMIYSMEDQLQWRLINQYPDVASDIQSDAEYLVEIIEYISRRNV